MKTFRIFTALALSATLAGFAQQASAQGCDGNQDCVSNGCSSQYRAVCRPVCTTKTVSEICWGEECEDFCVPGEVVHECRPRWNPFNLCCPGCGDCDSSCDSGCDSGCSNSGDCRCGTRCASPCGGTVFTRKKLMFQVVEYEVAVTKWEIEYCCDPCCDSSIEEDGIPVPTPAEDSASYDYNYLPVTH